ncbi:F-box-like protein [Carex littledalei]|uniref:F-box-like protein n=1 Tax=Carex littledalei TaxID=544730 RepID=A0A833RHW8_9POAL|nr:F-box-like protein [Carex littledalei]
MATALPAISSSSSSYCPQSWPDLPDELLQLIFLRLSHIQDLLAFSSVCRYWRSFATSFISTSPTSLFPPLLICPLIRFHPRRRRQLPVSSLKLLDPSMPHPNKLLLDSYNTSPVKESILSLNFLSSSHGHLLFLSLRRRQILILNFITGHQIISPVVPLPVDFDSFFQKNKEFDWSSERRLAQLTAPVSSPNCTLIFLAQKHLLLWKINSTDWSSHPLQVSLPYLRQMVVVGRKIWVLECGERLSILELPQDLSSKVVFSVVRWPVWEWDNGRIFEDPRLVDCEGEMLCVCVTSIDAPINMTDHVRTKICRFDISADKKRVVQIKSLGNRAIFLSAVLKVPGCVCNDPEKWGGKSNCIYYATNGKKKWVEMEAGVFAPEKLFKHSNRSTCSFPFWDFPSILQ